MPQPRIQPVGLTISASAICSLTCSASICSYALERSRAVWFPRQTPYGVVWSRSGVASSVTMAVWRRRVFGAWLSLRKSQPILTRSDALPMARLSASVRMFPERDLPSYRAVPRTTVRQPSTRATGEATGGADAVSGSSISLSQYTFLKIQIACRRSGQETEHEQDNGSTGHWERNVS